QPGETPAAVSSRIAESVGGVTVETRGEFASQERQLVGDMSADIITIMNTAGYLTGLAVVALTIYIATARRRRADGGLIAGVAPTVLLSVLIPRFNELIVLSMSMASLLRVTVISALIAGVAALL